MDPRQGCNMQKPSVSGILGSLSESPHGKSALSAHRATKGKDSKTPRLSEKPTPNEA